VVVAWSRENPEVPKFGVNPDRWLSGTRVSRLSSIHKFGNPRGLWVKFVLVWIVQKLRSPE
jgi:hypothetical protein